MENTEDEPPVDEAAGPDGVPPPTASHAQIERLRALGWDWITGDDGWRVLVDPEELAERAQAASEEEAPS
jgi:hypothetical protein